MAKSFTLTTPIYYVNSVPHIGTALTTLASDVVKRYRQLHGDDAFFVTGTDENGLKVMEAAQKAGQDTQAFVDGISDRFREIWTGMGISYDDFIRTTEDRHRVAVHKFFEILRERGYIYQGKYEGWYDVSTETFYKESDLVDGKSPDGNEVRWVEEENWFFKLTAFAEPLRQHIEDNPGFIVPDARRNEVLAFIDQGLRDVSISRSNPGWGITVPGDDTKVIYVWFDALINYVAATGWPNDGWQAKWPADEQWMGKDILTRFHATLWPAMLMGVGLPLPGRLVGHGWMLMGGEKISKSKGNVVAPLDLASQLAEISGCESAVAVDAVRHYMAATMPYESDSVFTDEDFYGRYNMDLANDLGNALNRSLSMAHKFIGGEIPDQGVEPEVAMAIEKARAGVRQAMDDSRVDRATEAAMGLVRFLNKHIDTRAPWALAKNNDASVGAVMRSVLLGVDAAAGLLSPAMPAASALIAQQLGLAPIAKWEQIGDPARLPAGHKLGQPAPVFPRVDLKALFKEAAAEPAAPKPEKKPSKKAKFEPPAEIAIEDVMKVNLRVARIIEAEELPGSDKLLRLQVRIGDEPRQILAGIKKQYRPEDLIGRQVVVVANLKPARLMGEESQGMLLAADGPNGEAILLQPEAEAPDGTSVH